MQGNQTQKSPGGGRVEWPSKVPTYLGDGYNGEHIPFAEGKVLLGSAMEVVLGNTFCTGRPGGLQGGQQMGGSNLGSTPPTCLHSSQVVSPMRGSSRELWVPSS